MNSFGSRIEASKLVDEPTPLRVRHRFKPVMRAQLAIDVMQMIPKRLGGNVELGRNHGWITTVCEEGKYAALLVG